MPIVTTSSRKRKTSKFSVIIILLAAVIGTVVCLLLRKKEADATVPETPVAVNSPKPTKTEIPVTASKPVTTAPVAVPVTKDEALFNKTNNYVKKPGQMMLPDGKVLTFPPPKNGETKKVAAYGHIYECDSEGNWKDVTPRRFFDTAFEANFLAMSVEGRTFIPAFLVGLDQDEVIKILQKDYVAKGDETEEEMAQIQTYIEMKNIALDYIAQGGTFDDFVNEIAAFEKAQRQVRANGLRQVMTLFKEGKIEEAKAKAEAINAVITEQGYKPLKIPAHVRRAFGEGDELPAENKL